jgi:hypothetical protein
VANSTFISRTPNPEEKDYISIVNDTIRKGGTISPNSQTFISALAQYNDGLIRGSTRRLEVPAGFCGYIDPASGEFRVEPDLESTLKSSTLYPDNAKTASDVPPVIVTPYPIDCQLRSGLPGSYEYTKSDDGCEDKEDGDNACSGIFWFSGPAAELYNPGEPTGLVYIEEEFNINPPTDGDGSEPEDDLRPVCGAGVGINSNTGLASSSSSTFLGDITKVPSDVLTAANERAFDTPTGRDPGRTGTGEISYARTIEEMGTLIEYTFHYNVNDPGHLTGPEYYHEFPNGVEVVVLWDTENEEVVDVQGYQRY